MNNSQIWENIFANKEWGKYPSEYLIRFIARNFYNVSNRKDINILELGLGTGANLWFCAREGFSVSGIEWSQNGVDRFLKRMKEENLLNFIKDIKIGDYFEKLDEFEDESFDCIIENLSWCCNEREKTKAIFEKSIKKLKPNGKFISATIGSNTFGFDKHKFDLQEIKEGIYTDVGLLRCDDELSSKELYSANDFVLEHLHKISCENNGIIYNELLIIEGRKFAV
ncbi:class I SAM-dependent methyltransferase [Campylobacter volucris]|uniref:class I SAM-dependent methyltransferase n=1 Tax=Campylobacter volucris TaxID=1031542 RepID=UPI00189D2118|nr:class I SAM-dependent methyltransferase [Campylobacter volucris]MBF7048982.1 class I SAM-dependent methyltransferase [Campylobacter volucris]